MRRTITAAMLLVASACGGGGGHGDSGPADGTVPTSGLGGPCRSDEDCGLVTDGVCLRDFGAVSLPGGYCSRSCTAGSMLDTCGPDAACLLSAGDGRYACALSCDAPADCRVAEGYVCHPVSGARGFCTP